MGTLDDRAVFVAVADCGSFTEAAVRLGVPVSTVSRRVAHLEAELRVSLLSRTTRHVSLTAAGREYAEQMRSLLAQISALEARLLTADTLATGMLRVAAPTGLGRPFFGPALTAFRHAHPGVELVWTPVSELVHPIRDGFDVVISDGRVVDAELVARRVLRTQDMCVASPHHIEMHGEPARPLDLADQDALVNTMSGPVHWPLLRGGTVTVRPVLRCSDYGLLTDAAIHGLGIALLPRAFVQPFFDSGALRPLLEGVVGSWRDIHIVYSRRTHQSSILSVFVSFVLAYVKRSGHLGNIE